MKISRRFFNKSVLASTAVLGTAGCASNLATGRMALIGSTIKQDIEYSKKNHSKILQENGGEYENRKLQKYLSSVGNKLAEYAEIKEYPYKFFVLDSPEVNAFVTPGGYVYFYRGLISLFNNEAELASIVGHELGHANARHSSERMGQYFWTSVGKTFVDAFLGQQNKQLASQGLDFLTTTLLMGFSREQEFEADKLGIRYMSLAGYDPEGSITAFETLYNHKKLQSAMKGLPEGEVDKYDIMSTHPRNKDRIKKAMEEAVNYQPADPKVNEEAFFDVIDGMSFGSKIAGGYIRGQNYLNSDINVRFTLPEGFRFLSGGDLYTGIIATDYKNESLIIFAEDDATIIKGISGKTKILELIEKDDIYVKEDKSIKEDKTKKNYKKKYCFTFIDSKNNGRDFSDWEQHILSSFKKISDDEADNLKIGTIKILKNIKNKNISELSKTLPFGDYNNSYFCVLNGLDFYDYMLKAENKDLVDDEITEKYLKVLT